MNSSQTRSVVNRIHFLQLDHELAPSDYFHFKYVEVALSVGMNKVAISSVTKYFATSSRRRPIT